MTNHAATDRGMAKSVLHSSVAVGFAVLNLCFIYSTFAPRRLDLVARFEHTASFDSRISSSITSSSTTGSSTNSTSGSTGTTNAANFDPVQEQNSPPPPGVCDLSHGRWVPDSRPPLYTNRTCEYIHPNQNCIKNGRPDLGYLSWRWIPDGGCELPSFDPALFLELLRGKRLAFIGDSLGRNHMQSLLCALAQIERPEMIGKFKYSGLEERWRFPFHNFTLRNIWSPFFVKYTAEKDIFKLQLDQVEEVWASHLGDYDIAVLGIGYWFFRRSVYFMNGRVIGCNPQAKLNCTNMDQMEALRMAHQQALKFMVDRFPGFVMLRTITIDHFEYGSWTDGGLCNRTGPFEDPDKHQMSWTGKLMYTIQTEEFNKAIQAAREPGDEKRFHLLDVTYSSFMRPDGHPNSFRIQQTKKKAYDCLHWCLPGPIDMWNQMVLQFLKNAGR